MPSPRAEGSKRAGSGKAKRQVKQSARGVKQAAPGAKKAAVQPVRKASSGVPASLPCWGGWFDEEGHTAGLFSAFESYSPGFLPPWGEWDRTQRQALEGTRAHFDAKVLPPWGGWT
jgi:hypothetical protein